MYFVIFLLGFLFCSTNCNREPHCSKFDYDEALLEKMIRTEYQFKRLQDEFTKLTESVQDTLQRVENTLEGYNERENKIMERVESRIENLPKRNHERETTDTQIVGFKATGLTNLHPDAGAILVFPKVLFNKGNGYDSSSGVFTAPVSGIYIFTVQTCTKPGKYQASSIMVDDKEYGLVFTQDHDWSVCNTGDAVAFLEAKKTVYIKVKQKDGSFASDIYRMNSFAGALLN